MHLISAHAYPKEYFFAITNKGIGGLLRRWGEGASLLRGQWRPRDNNDEDEDEGADDDGASLPPSSDQHSDDSDGPDDDDDDLEVEAAPAAPAVNGDGKTETEKMSEDSGGDDAVDTLTQGVSGLGLVPSSVRFGRGGSARGRAGLATRGGRSVARHLGHASHPAQSPQQSQAASITAVGESGEEKENTKAANDAEDSDVMEQDLIVAPEKPISAARGRRGRGRAGGGGGGVGRGMGRGRGGFVPPPPRAGFLARGGHSRGLPRGMISNVMRARGRGASI